MELPPSSSGLNAKRSDTSCCDWHNRMNASRLEKSMTPSLIVHPVSYSPSGKTALATAVAIARVCGADLHVLELAGRRGTSADPIVRPITDEAVEPHFAEFVRSVYSADVNISAVELAGDVVDAVVEYAKSTSADLVIVADQARSHGPYWRRGRYANDLARHLSVPLVSVPATRDERLAREGASSEEAKSHAEAIARMLERNALAQTSTDAEREMLVKPRAIGDSTLTAAGEVVADVIVARAGLHHHVAMSSSLARLLRSAPRPVLVVPAAAADRRPVLLETDFAAFESALPR
jgi:nucleotide-binding universal stress UspA family protein